MLHAHTAVAAPAANIFSPIRRVKEKKINLSLCDFVHGKFTTHVWSVAMASALHTYACTQQTTFISRYHQPITLHFFSYFLRFEQTKREEKKSQSEARSRVKCKHFNLRMGLPTQLNSH